MTGRGAYGQAYQLPFIRGYPLPYSILQRGIPNVIAPAESGLYRPKVLSSYDPSPPPPCHTQCQAKDSRLELQKTQAMKDLVVTKARELETACATTLMQVRGARSTGRCIDAGQGGEEHGTVY